MSVFAIHHVTAVTARIAENLDFYTKVLGLRLVKRSVNQDDVSAYHLFYADAVGSPGTDMTFFDWPMAGQNVPGAGTIALTSFAVPRGSLDWWESRLGLSASSPVRMENSILFADPEGQRLELVETVEAPAKSQPWTAAVPEDQAIRGILGVDLCSRRPESTRQILTEILKFESTAEDVFVTMGPVSHARLRIVAPSSEGHGRVGAGGVHHVAFRVPDDDHLYKTQEKVEALGIRTSGFIDRYYFHSLYFREPGGVLFEVATDGPGFASDESLDALGAKLALPPFLEPQRKSIEAGLHPLPV